MKIGLFLKEEYISLPLPKPNSDTDSRYTNLHTTSSLVKSKREMMTSHVYKRQS